MCCWVKVDSRKAEFGTGKREESISVAKERDRGNESGEIYPSIKKT
jgi:hypothetical protein